MPRASRTLSGWSAGEWSPLLAARVDLSQYPRSLRWCSNFIVTPEGALLRRPPTRFVARITTEEFGDAALVPFVPDADDSYVVLLLGRVLRVYDKEGTEVAATVSPFSASMVTEVGWAQDADVLYLVHPDVAPQKLSRTAVGPPATFSLAPVTFSEGRAPLNTLNTTTTTMALTGTWPGSLTLTASANTFIATDVGRIVYLRDATNARGAYVSISTVSSPTVATVTGVFRSGNTAALPASTTQWALGLFSGNRGCRAVAFHEGRLWYAGFADAPDTLCGSVSNAFDNFETVSPDPAVNDAANADKAITRRAGSGTVEAINWLLSGSDVMLIGTNGGEFVLRPGVTGFLTPTEASIRRATGRGSEPGVAPLRIDSSAFFAQRGGQRLRQVRYDIESDGFVTEDATLLCSHLLEEGVRRLAYQQTPWSVIWLVDRKNQLFGITVEGRQEVLGGHRHTLGGLFNGGPPAVRSVCAVPDTRVGASRRSDLVYFVVDRTVQNQTVRTLEVLGGEGPVLDDRAPAELRRHSVEMTPYMDCRVDHRAVLNTLERRIVGAREVAGVLRFYTQGSAPTGTVAMRGLVWRLGRDVLDTPVGNRETWEVLNTGTDAVGSWFSIVPPGSVGLPGLGLAELGLPPGAALWLQNDQFPPLVRRTFDEIRQPAGMPVPEAETGYAVLADDVEYRPSLGATVPAQVSIMFSGYEYRTELETNVLYLQAAVPSDAGAVTTLGLVTLWLWGGSDAFVSAGDAPPERAVVANLTDVMAAIPTPATKPLVVAPTTGGGLPSLRVYTDGFFPLNILGATVVVRSNPL